MKGLWFEYSSYRRLCAGKMQMFICIFLCILPIATSASLTVFGASVTNLNEPSRALATSTIMWVTS